MKFRILLFSIFIMSFFNCKSTATVAEIALLKKTILNESFEIVANSANPIAFANVRGLENLLPIGSSQSNINLVGNQNYFRSKKDSIDFDLPFYGERHVVSSYGSDNGLKFIGKIDRKKTTFNSKKNSYDIEYWLDDQTENLRVFITLYTNKTSILTVSSSHRSTIVYNGNWKELEK